MRHKLNESQSSSTKSMQFILEKKWYFEVSFSLSSIHLLLVDSPPDFQTFTFWARWISEGWHHKHLRLVTIKIKLISKAHLFSQDNLFMEQHIVTVNEVPWDTYWWVKVHIILSSIGAPEGDTPSSPGYYDVRTWDQEYSYSYNYFQNDLKITLIQRGKKREREKEKNERERELQRNGI